MARTAKAQEKGAKSKSKVTVSVPPELKAMLTSAAEEAKVELPQFVRQTLATKVGFTGQLATVAGRARKYANDEERKAAATKRRKSRADLFKRLLKEHEEAKEQ